MPLNAHITVYLQALGAHFLGKNAYNPKDITIKLSNSCADPIPVPYSIKENDGTSLKTFTSGSSSFMPVISVLQAPSDILPWYIFRDSSTACGSANFDLPDKIDFGYLDVSIPTSAGSPMSVRYQVLLNPEKL